MVNLDLKTTPKTQALRQAPRAIFALMLREFNTGFGRTRGGYIWAVLEPALGITLLSFIFSLALRAPPLGTDFALFYATGLLPYLAFSNISKKTASAFSQARALFMHPLLTVIDAIIARFLLVTLTQLCIAALVITFIIWMFAPVIAPAPALLILATLQLMLIAFGIGLINSSLFLISPIWSRIWGIISRPLLILSCVFYLFEKVPHPYQDWLWFNPLIHIIGLFRAGVYHNYHAQYVEPLYVLSLALWLILIGLVLLAQNKENLIDH